MYMKAKKNLGKNGCILKKGQKERVSCIIQRCNSGIIEISWLKEYVGYTHTFKNKKEFDKYIKLIF